jgi:hypothetical protein
MGWQDTQIDFPTCLGKINDGDDPGDDDDVRFRTFFFS